MELDQPTPAYRGFLRSGSYPALSHRLRRSGELAGRAASLVALAALAAGAGYKLTQRVVAPSAGNTPRHGLPAEPQLARHAIGALSLTQAEPDPVASAAPLPAATVQPPTAASSAHKRAGTTGTTGMSPKTQAPRPLAEAQPAKHKPNESPAASEAAPAHAEVRAAAEQARTEMIAERVRALDEAARAEPAPIVRAAAPAPAPVAPKPAPAAANAPPLRAAAKILELEVRGSLSASSVRRGLERVRPVFASCYAQAAQQAQRNDFRNVQLRFVIDETGRTRAPKVADTALPGLEACLRSAIGKLVCQAPDTGTVQASLLVGFTP